MTNYYYYYLCLSRFKSFDSKGRYQWFDNEQDAKTFSSSGGTAIEYKGFHITPDFKIIKNGKFIFTAWHQRCYSLQDAMNIIDSSVIAKELFDKLPNLSKIDIPDFCELENGFQKREEETEKINNHFEITNYER